MTCYIIMFVLKKPRSCWLPWRGFLCASQKPLHNTSFVSVLNKVTELSRTSLFPPRTFHHRSECGSFFFPKCPQGWVGSKGKYCTSLSKASVCACFHALWYTLYSYPYWFPHHSKSSKDTKFGRTWMLKFNLQVCSSMKGKPYMPSPFQTRHLLQDYGLIQDHREPQKHWFISLQPGDQELGGSGKRQSPHYKNQDHSLCSLNRQTHIKPVTKKNGRHPNCHLQVWICWLCFALWRV